MTQNHSKYPIPFPLDDVGIRKTDTISNVQNPFYSNEWMSIGPSEFSMRIENVGSFYACHGNRIEYSPVEKADGAAIELYMNGSVYGAILHQRRILPLHGSSFVYNGNGIIFCGDSGAGKSSLTTSFCMNGADFLTDDVTPIIKKNGKPHIWPKSGKVKLWDDTLHQLNRDKSRLTKIRPEDEKYYLPLKPQHLSSNSLDHILILQVSDESDVSFETVQKVEAFSYLHQEIYRREFLFAMPEAESAYLKQIGDICNNSLITRIRRPQDIPIGEMQEKISNYLDSA